jgi:ribosome-binding protein aMBF1 (putative translation factor)
MKPIAHWIEEKQMDFDELVATSGLDRKLVRAIVSGNYTPSPSQRRSLAAALGVTVEEVSWGHVVPVEHMYGHGPQFGRSP